MATTTFLVTKCPSNELSLFNCIIMNPEDKKHFRYIKFFNRGQQFVFTSLADSGVQKGYLGFSMVQRRWAYVGINQEIQVQNLVVTKNDILSELYLEIDFYRNKEATGQAFDTDAMADDFRRKNVDRVFVGGETLIVLFQGRHFSIVVQSLKTTSKEQNIGVLQVKISY